MRRSRRHYDEWAEQLSAGVAAPEDPVAAFVGALRSAEEETTTEELTAALAAQSRSVVEDSPNTSGSGSDRQPLIPRWRRRVMISAFLSTLFGKIAVGTAAFAVAATGAVATGNLPDPAQQRVSDALARVGIEVPAPDSVPDADLGAADADNASVEASAPVLPETASDKAKSVVETVFDSDASGRELGEAVSGVAKDGAATGEKPDVPAAPEGVETPEVPAAPESPESPVTPDLPDAVGEGFDLRP